MDYLSTQLCMQVSHADKTWFLAIKNVSSNAKDSWTLPYLAMIDGNPTGAGVDRSIGKRAASPVLVGKEEGGKSSEKGRSQQKSTSLHPCLL